MDSTTFTPNASPSDFVPAPLSRSVSQQSRSSLKSRKTGTSTYRSRKRISQTSSYASSVAASDRSLTSFPSFSPGSPEDHNDDDDDYHGRPFFSATTPTTVAATDPEHASLSLSLSSLSSSIPKRLQLHLGAEASSSALATTPTSRPAQLVDALSIAMPAPPPPEHASAASSPPPPPPALDSASLRSALFDDAPPISANIPGALHRAGDAHIERLIARHGAVGLTRLLAEDLARRDVQIAALRRRAEARERALRKIILECGLSNLELETRLRSVEAETRIGAMAKPRREPGEADSGISDLVSDAMGEDVGTATWIETHPPDTQDRPGGFSGDATSQAPDATKAGPVRGWKDYLWAKAATVSRASSVNGDPPPTTAAAAAATTTATSTTTTSTTTTSTTTTSTTTTPPKYPTVVKAPPPGDKRPSLGDHLFIPPRNDADRSPSRSSSVAPASSGRKSSLASMALRLVSGGVMSSRDGEARGRASAAAAAHNQDARSRSTSMASGSGRTVSAHGGPKALMAMRRSAPTSNVSAPPTRTAVNNERWDTMVGSPPGASASRQESYGPVEMDTIRPAEAQPPTLTRVYNNYPNSEFLTDRFGFIYDQRRKKREREAAQMARQLKQSGRAEMLSSARSSSAALLTESSSLRSETPSGDRPETPESLEDHLAEPGLRAKRWQDYLKAATFPTELLSHTPGTNTRLLEVTEGTGSGSGSGSETPRSPSLITGERGFLPPASTTSALDNETVAAPVEADGAAGMLVKEDMEPTRLLLQQLNDVHDSLQREKTVKWNDFMRKVRAERRREGEAEAAAAAAAAEARFEQPVLILPEARLHDGEMIGIADLGNKGKIGRAKWNEFKALVLGGIPVAYRPKVWAECSGAVTLRIPGYYDDIISRPATEDDSAVVGQIEMDIRRTLTDNIFFRKGPGVEQLKSVLFAYARRNPEIGYCQGMNLIAANLLLVMPSAEDAFWILVSIIENILPAGYHDDSLLASRADQQVLRHYVSTVLPRLSRHLDTLAIELEALTFQWFLSVFTDLLSAEALFRVWDVVLCMGTDGGGATFLFRVALALLKLNEAPLLRCDSPAAAYTYINHQMTNHAISIDGLIHAGEALRKVVKREDVEMRRETAVAHEKENLRMRSEEGLRPTRKRVVSGTSSAASMDSGSPSGDLVVRDPVPMDQEEVPS